MGSEEASCVADEIIDASASPIETEADHFALDILIPPNVWAGQIRQLQHATEIRAAAKRLCVHPAVIAGRLRHEANDYRLHRTLVGYNQVKPVFGIIDEN